MCTLLTESSGRLQDLPTVFPCIVAIVLLMNIHLIPPSHQTSSHYFGLNRLKLCLNRNIVQTSCMGHELPERARTFRTLNLLNIFWRPSRFESVQKNVVTAISNDRSPIPINMTAKPMMGHQSQMINPQSS